MTDLEPAESPDNPDVTTPTKATKAIVAAVGGLCSVVVASLADDVFGFDDWGTVASAVGILAATVIGVYRVTNKRKITNRIR